MGCSPRKLAVGNVYYFRCNTYATNTKLSYCTSHSIRMDYVEQLIIDRIKQIIHNFSEKNKMIAVTKQKLQELKQNNTYISELEKCKIRLSKLLLDIDNIYNDKLNGILVQDDFYRIYESKKQEKLQIQNKIDTLKFHIKQNTINEEELINNLIEKFNANLIINREILISMIDRIEIGEYKKIYVFFKFKSF